MIRDVVEIVRKSGSLQSVTSVKSRKLILNFIQQRCNSCTWDSTYIALLESEIVNFSLVLSRKWLKSYRKFYKFYTMNTDWLNTIFEIPPLILQTLVSNSANIGRPVKMFMESSERTKRRKINNLITSSNMTSPEILYASNSKFQQHGQRSIVQHFKEVTSSPSRVFKIAIQKSNTTELVPYTAHEALAFFVENNLTKEQYKNTRLSAKNRNADIYPSYASIIDAKKLLPEQLCCI